MKGIKYTYTLTIPHDKEIIKYQLSMDELIDDLKQKYLEFYYIEPNITSHIIYNLIKRPDKVNRILRKNLIIKKM